MRGGDQLLTIAELAIGLAGFSAVVVGFVHRGRLSEIDRMRFIAILTLTLTGAVLAFVPHLLDLAGTSGDVLWRSASGCFLVVILSYVFYFSRLRAAAIRAGAPAPFIVRLGLLVLSVLNLALQLSNVAGWPSDPGPFPYIAGLVVVLICASAFFAFLVLLRPEEPAA
jgi:hypothetical protein